MKTCFTCEVEKPVTDFHKRTVRNGKQIYQPACKDCINRRNREQHVPSERTIQRQSDLASQTKVCVRCGIRKPFDDFSRRSARGGRPQSYCKVCDVDYQRMYKFGLDPEAYQALLTSQDGLCGGCREPLAVGSAHGCNVDHCHETKLVRGLLCNHCNLALGHLKDDEDRILGLLSYLRAASNVPT